MIVLLVVVGCRPQKEDTSFILQYHADEYSSALSNSFFSLQPKLIYRDSVLLDKVAGLHRALLNAYAQFGQPEEIARMVPKLKDALARVDPDTTAMDATLKEILQDESWRRMSEEDQQWVILGLFAEAMRVYDWYEADFERMGNDWSWCNGGPHRYQPEIPFRIILYLQIESKKRSLLGGSDFYLVSEDGQQIPLEAKLSGNYLYAESEWPEPGLYTVQGFAKLERLPELPWLDSLQSVSFPLEIYTE